MFVNALKDCSVREGEINTRLRFGGDDGFV